MTGSSLPEFTVRRSKRARRVRLSVSARDGLVVVVPERWRGDVDEVVRLRAEWAERALARVADRRAELTADPEIMLPSEVDMPGIGLRVTVEYDRRDSARVTARLVGSAILVRGDIDDAQACLDALRRWLATESKRQLPAVVLSLAEAHGLSPSAVRVGGAKTRWGSCSSRGTISLNRTCVFLPAHLLDALVLHELAHLDVMNHSAAFWARLRGMDERADEHRRQLRDAERHVPAWAYA